MENNQSSDNLVQQGCVLLRLSKYNHAEKKFAEALVKDSENDYALWGIGVSLMNQGKVREGKRELEKGLALYPKNELFAEELTSYELDCKNYTQAEYLGQQWLHNHPQSAQAHAMMGKIHLHKKNVDKKIVFNYFREALKINPYCLDAIDGIAYASWDLNKDKKTAIEEYRRIIKHDPYNAVLRNNFGVTLLRIGEGKLALEEFKQAIRLDPSFSLASDNILQALALTHPAFAWVYKIDRFLYANMWRRIVIMLLLYLFARGLLILYVLYKLVIFRMLIAFIKKGLIK